MIWHDDGIFITADAEYFVAFADTVLQFFRNNNQQFVSAAVSVIVIYRLEFVQVNVEDGKGLFLGMQLIEGLIEFAVVLQLGQSINIGEFFESRLPADKIPAALKEISRVKIRPMIISKMMIE